MANCNPGSQQYIGARYVPRHMGEWSADTQYSALDVVLYTDGNSYTAKCYPPKGTVPTDNKYWSLSAQFNQQLAALSDKLDRLNNAVRYFDTVSALKECANIKTGDIVETSGFYNKNDGGGCSYLVSDTGDIYSVELENGLFAIPLFDEKANFKCFGAYSNPTSYVDDILDDALSFCAEHGLTLFIPSENYYLNKEHNINKSVAITGDFVKGKNTGDGRVAEFNIIYSGPGYCFNIENSCAYVNITGIAVKCNSNGFVKFDAHRNKLKNCYIETAEKAVYLTRTDSSVAGVTYENKIEGNIFYNSHISIYCDYNKGASTDGFVIDNIFVDSKEAGRTESYSIKATVLSQWIISRNHDYSINGIEIAQGINLMINDNYFDNTDKTSILIIVNGSVIIDANQFLSDGGTEPSSTFTKINLTTSPEYPASSAIVSNNMLVDVGGKYAGNVSLLTSAIPVSLAGNIVNGTAKVIDGVTDNRHVQASAINRFEWDISERYKEAENVTFVQCKAMYSQKKIAIDCSFTTTAQITAFSQSIFADNPPAPSISRSGETVYVIACTNNGDVFPLAFRNKGSVLTPLIDIPNETQLFFHCEFFTDDLNSDII